MLFTRVRMKYKGNTLDCTNFFSLSTTNQDAYHNADNRNKMAILVKLFRSALFGKDQMIFDTYDDFQKISLARTWYEISEKIVLNKEEENVVY